MVMYRLYRFDHEIFICKIKQGLSLGFMIRVMCESLAVLVYGLRLELGLCVNLRTIELTDNIHGTGWVCYPQGLLSLGFLNPNVTVLRLTHGQPNHINS